MHNFNTNWGLVQNDQQNVLAAWIKEASDRGSTPPQKNLFNLFHRLMMPQIKQLFQHKKGVQMWAIFMGTGKSFVIHLTRGFKTSSVYNPIEPDKVNPMLVYGQRITISRLLNREIQEKFAQYNAWYDLPYQMAFGMNYSSQLTQCSSNPQQRDRLIAHLIQYPGISIQWGSFKIFSLTPPGSGNTCSFKRDTFPLQIWTHEKQPSALIAARDQALKQAKKIAIFNDVIKAELKIKTIKRDLIWIPEQIQCLLQDIENIRKTEKNSKDLNGKIASKNENIKTQETLETTWTTDLNKAQSEFNDLKKKHNSILPSSYLGQTFLLGAKITEPRGNFKIFSLAPPGSGNTCSFKRDTFPLQIWTHEKQPSALIAARDQTLLQEPTKKVAIFNDVIKAERTIRMIKGNLMRIPEQIRCLLQDIENIRKTEKNPKALNGKIASKNKSIRTQETLETTWTTDLNKAQSELNDLKKKHNSILPSSYLVGTFLLGAKITKPNGTIVYKRFRTTGEVITSTQEDSISNQNNVHHKYR